MALVLASLACSSLPHRRGDQARLGLHRPRTIALDTPSTPDVRWCPIDRPVVTCDDTDGDGISNGDEGAGARHRRRHDAGLHGHRLGRRRFQRRRRGRAEYTGYESAMVPVFAATSPTTATRPQTTSPTSDLDCDNDGLTDAEERMAGTNPCSEDSDRDGFADLAEVAARSNPGT
ncbi:MAG: hypothetical protein IPF99_27230 [Deltaproteobacteria bacterium]|nr:hypothetical protein [Deltaproteobacteria bacterium]